MYSLIVRTGEPGRTATGSLEGAGDDDTGDGAVRLAGDEADTAGPEIGEEVGKACAEGDEDADAPEGKYGLIPPSAETESEAETGSTAA